MTGPPDIVGNGAAAGAESGEGRNLPVLAAPEPRALVPTEAVAPALFAATGGLLAGVGAFVLVRLLRRTAAAPAILRRRGGRRRREVAATRSFLVDVHLLRR